MASTKPAMLSSRPVVSQVSAYLRPFCTEQYHTMMPSRSCVSSSLDHHPQRHLHNEHHYLPLTCRTASLASFMMCLLEVEPFAPSRIRSLGTST